MDVRSQLSFPAENRSLSGRYTCVADNEVGDPAIAHIDLRIRCELHLYLQLLLAADPLKLLLFTILTIFFLPPFIIFMSLQLL